jgi:hypothetical protein
MARGLVESTADFLATGMDEYFSGLHDVDDNEKHWLVSTNDRLCKILQFLISSIFM